jgi:hypothetical protein
VTLARLVRRNVATDEYRYALDRVRTMITTFVGGPLEGYHPFPVATAQVERPLKRLLGLTLLMSTINAILLAAGTVLAIVPGWGVGLVIGVLTLAVTLVAQVSLASRLRRRLEIEVGLEAD